MPDGVEVAACLYAATDDGQARGAGAGKPINGHGRDGRRAGFGDVAPVEQGDERAGGRVQQDDCRQVRRQATRVVAGIHGDEFGAHGRRRIDHGRHDAEVRALGADLDDRPYRLRHAVRGVFGQRRAHGLNQIRHG